MKKYVLLLALALSFSSASFSMTNDQQAQCEKDGKGQQNPDVLEKLTIIINMIDSREESIRIPYFKHIGKLIEASTSCEDFNQREINYIFHVGKTLEATNQTLFNAITIESLK